MKDKTADCHRRWTRVVGLAAILQGEVIGLEAVVAAAAVAVAA